jgi:peptide/nickel transport system substrate-binding protein
MEKKMAAAIAMVVIVVVGAIAGYYLFMMQKPVTYETTLRRAEPATIVTDLDPSTQFSDEIVIICGNMYESLTRVNPDGKVIGVLATNWTHSADGLTWNFTLRQGVKFHDGTLMNSTAVKLSIERTTRMGMGAAFIWACVNRTVTFDDKPYLIQFKLNFAAPLDRIAAASYAAWIFSPKVFEHGNDSQIHDWLYPPSGTGGIFAGNPPYDVGTGPYYLYSWERGGDVILKKFDDYWGGWNNGPYYETIYTTYVAEAATRKEGILGGTYDFTYMLAKEDLASVNASTAAKVVAIPSFQNLLGFFNLKRYPTNITLVRQALAYAIPYQKIISDVLMGYGVQSKGPIPSGLFGHADDLFQYTQNITKATELFAEAGVDPKTLHLLLTYNIADPDETKVAEIMKTEFSDKLGIDLEARGLSWDAQWDLAKADPTTAQHIFVMYWWPTILSGYDFLINMFHTEPTVFFNLGYYYNSTFDNLIDTAYSLEATDPTTSLQKYKQAQEMLINDCPSAFLYDLENTHVIRKDISGYVDNPAYPHVVFYYELRPPVTKKTSSFIEYTDYLIPSFCLTTITMMAYLVKRRWDCLPTYRRELSYQS